MICADTCACAVCGGCQTAWENAGIHGKNVSHIFQTRHGYDVKGERLKVKQQMYHLGGVDLAWLGSGTDRYHDMYALLSSTNEYCGIFFLSVFLVHFDLSLFNIDICIDLVLQLLTYN